MMKHAGSIDWPAIGVAINNETAKKVAAAAIAEAKKRNWNTMCVSVVDPYGDLVYFERQDNCQLASISISQHKARTAARYRRPTVVFERLLGKGPYFAYLTTLDDMIVSRGGNPLDRSMARSSAPLVPAAAPVRKTTQFPRRALPD